MAKYEVRVRYAFEGTYMVAAGNREEAKRMVEEDCGLVLGGNIHTTRDDDEDSLDQGNGQESPGKIHRDEFQRPD